MRRAASLGLAAAAALAAQAAAEVYSAEDCREEVTDAG